VLAVGAEELNLHKRSVTQASARSRLDNPAAFAY
jgi:hypothetical protein